MCPLICASLYVPLATSNICPDMHILPPTAGIGDMSSLSEADLPAQGETRVTSEPPVNSRTLVSGKRQAQAPIVTWPTTVTEPERVRWPCGGHLGRTWLLCTTFVITALTLTRLKRNSRASLYETNILPPPNKQTHNLVHYSGLHLCILNFLHVSIVNPHTHYTLSCIPPNGVIDGTGTHAFAAHEIGCSFDF